MNLKRSLFLLLLLLFPTLLRAQDARGMAVGYATTAAPLGVFGLFWNPALEAVPDNTTWTIAGGYSAFDTSNTNSAILRFSQGAAYQSGQDPVSQFQQYAGTFAVKYGNISFGAFYEDDQSLFSNQGALKFFNDRSSTLSPGSSYGLNYQQNQQTIQTFVLSYASPIPLGTFQFLSAGYSLKYHYGSQYSQTSLTGTYTQGSSTGYTYTKTNSTSGLGLSMDLGFAAKISDSINMGFMMENLQSNYNWQAQQATYNLDSITGQETQASSSPVSVNAPMPYTTKLGIAIAPPDKGTFLEGEVSWVNNQTYWRGGIEKYYANGMVFRFGTFADQYSGQQLWGFGLGFFKANFNVDLSLLTRSIPDLQDSIALGGGIDAAIRF